jgi:hypothetical protein
MVMYVHVVSDLFVHCNRPTFGWRALSRLLACRCEGSSVT